MKLKFAPGILRHDFYISEDARREVASLLFGSTVSDVRPAGRIERASFYSAATESGPRRIVLKQVGGAPVSEAIAIRASRELGANSYAAVILDDCLALEEVSGRTGHSYGPKIVNWAEEIGSQVPYAVLLNSLDASRTNIVVEGSGGEKKATVIDYGFGLQCSDGFSAAEIEYFAGQDLRENYSSGYWRGVSSGKAHSSSACTPKFIEGVLGLIGENSGRIYHESGRPVKELSDSLASRMFYLSRLWGIETGISNAVSFFFPKGRN